MNLFSPSELRGRQSGQIIQLSRPLCETVVLCPCRRHTGNMTSTTRQQHVQTDPEKPSSSSRSCVMLSIQLTRTVAKSNSRDGEIDVCLVICFRDKEKKRQNKMPQGQYQLPRLIDPSWRHSLSLSLHNNNNNSFFFLPMSIGRKRCGPNQSCAMIRFRHVVFYWFLSISGSLFFFSLRGQDCRQSSLWVMCHHSICRGRGGGGGYVRKVGRTAPPSGWIDPLLSSLTISRYPPVTDRTEYIYIYIPDWLVLGKERAENEPLSASGLISTHRRRGREGLSRGSSANWWWWWPSLYVIDRHCCCGTAQSESIKLKRVFFFEKRRGRMYIWTLEINDHSGELDGVGKWPLYFTRSRRL